MIKTKSILFSLFAASIFFTGCGGGTTNQNDSTIENDPSNNPQIENTKLAKAQLGVLSNATVKIEELGVVPYKLLFTETTSDGDSIEKIGNFNAHPKELEKDKFYLYTVIGGLDKDANDDGVIDLIPKVNNGAFHAIIKGETLKKLKGKFKVTATTELQYKKVKTDINDTENLDTKLQSAAKEILKDGTNESILQYDPVEDREKLHEVYHDRLPEIIQDIHEDKKEPVEKQVPTANAGGDRSMMLEGHLELIASSFDIDGHIVSYAWHEGDTLLSERKSFTYIPDSLGKHTLTLTITDNDDLQDEDSITITVTEKPNTIPVAQSETISLSEESQKEIVLYANDADEDTLTYKILTEPIHGTLRGEAPNLTYTPSKDYFGEDRIIFTVNDGKDDSQKAYITLKVTNTNDAPIAYAQTIIMDEDSSKSITLQASDIDSDSVDFKIVKNPTHGELSGTAPNLTYIPNADYFGNDSFSYKVEDETSSSSEAVVDIMIKNIADTPTASSQKVAIKIDTKKTIDLVNDATTTYDILSFPKHGTLTLTKPNPTYMPDEGYLGEDSFSYRVRNGDKESTSATIELYITEYQRTSIKRDNNNDGKIDEEYITTYNIEGKKIFYSEDEDGDGKVDFKRIRTYVKESNGTISVTEDNFGDENYTNYYIYDPNWRLLQGVSHHSTYYGVEGKFIGTSRTIMTYDKYGNTLSRDEYGDYGSKVHTESHYKYAYEYDENGNKIKEAVDYPGDGTFSRVTTFEYDENDKLIQSTQRKNGLLIDTCDYEYNWLGNILSKDCQRSYSKYEYAENGKDIVYKEEAFSSDFKQFTYFTYDEEGREIEKKVMMRNNIYPDRDDTYKTTYDANGNKSIYEIEYVNDGKTTGHHIYHYSYDANGNIIKSEADNDSDGEIDAVGYYEWG